MMIIWRKAGEEFELVMGSSHVTIKVDRVQGNVAKIAIEAPKEVQIYHEGTGRARDEVHRSR